MMFKSALSVALLSALASSVFAQDPNNVNITSVDVVAITVPSASYYWGALSPCRLKKKKSNYSFFFLVIIFTLYRDSYDDQWQRRLTTWRGIAPTLLRE